MKRPKDLRGDYSVGQYLKLYKRIKSYLDKRSEAGHNIRVNVGNKIVEVTPTYDNKNIQPGTVLGAIYAAVARTSDEIIPFDIMAETEITNTEKVKNGTKYIVNVDSPLHQQAKFQALMEAGTGFTSFVVDEFDFQSEEVLRKRPGRDTWQFEVVVKEPEADVSDIPVLGKLNVAKDSQM